MSKTSKFAAMLSVLGVSAALVAGGATMHANAAQRQNQQTYTLACKVAASDVATQIDITNKTTNSVAKGSAIHWQVTGGNGGSGVETLSAQLPNAGSNNYIRVWVSASPPAGGMTCTAWYKA